MPPLRELGLDLTRISPSRRLVSLALPLILCEAYFAFAFQRLVASCCLRPGGVELRHVWVDLTRPRPPESGAAPAVNEVLLSLIELLALQSGHAYRVAQLHHHAHFPRQDDIDAATTRMSLLGALAEASSCSPECGSGHCGTEDSRESGSLARGSPAYFWSAQRWPLLAYHSYFRSTPS